MTVAKKKMDELAPKSSTTKKVYLKRFLQTYKTLNSSQKIAVDTIEGPVMVLAGPGTGKTQILAMRIANILLKTDTAPHNILALTFTESAVKAMRDRLLSIIGEDAYYVNISTFHAFCSEIIQSHPEFFPFSRDAEPLSDIERFELIESIIHGQPFEAIKPINSPTFYVRECISAIQDLKREGVEPNDYRKLIDQMAVQLTEVNTKGKSELSATQQKTLEKSVAKNRELLQVYILYEKSLRERNRYDYEDMISLTINAFTKDPLLLQTYQERLHYFLVDEYQDTNSAQNHVLELLAEFWGDEANVFVVGDADQSLYRFQGASIENSLSFIKKYKKAQVITLQQNYRSPQDILDVAHLLIKRNALSNGEVLKIASKKIEKQSPLVSTIKTPTKKQNIEVASLSSDISETLYIVEKIKELIESGVKPDEIAVLYRNNADSFAFEDALAKWGIRYELDAGANVLDTPIVQQLLLLFQVIYGMRTTQEDLDLFTIMNYSWSMLNTLDILKIARAAAQQKTSMFAILTSKKLDGLELENREKLLKFIQNLLHWSQLDAQQTFPLWVETVLNESMMLPWILEQPNAIEMVNSIQSVFSEVKRIARGDHTLNLEKFLAVIATMQEHHLKIREEKMAYTKTDAVKLTTAHSAKGLEWEYVFISRALDGKWGNVRSRDLISLPQGVLKNTDIDEKDQNEDERRVFYVALTRAKKHVIITYAEKTVVGDRLKDTTRSMFLEEIPKKNIFATDIRAFEKAVPVLVSKLLQIPKDIQPQLEEQEWLMGLLKDFVLTPTSLNTYLECAYKFKLNVLIKVPRAKQDYLAFGTAIHKALEMFYRSLMEHDLPPNKEYLIDQFELALKKEILTKDEEEKRLNQGRKILSAYYDRYKDEFGRPVFLEKFLGYGWSRVYVDDVRIGGRIDKVEWIDQKHNLVSVVDYKTGQPKTRNEIEGKTAHSDGNYKRQLLFYKLLADLDKSFTLVVKNGVFSFIEPDKQTGKLRREEFELKKEEVDDLRKTIKEVMSEIRALHFARTTNYSICKRCEFVNHCWPLGIPTQNAEQMKLL